MNSDGLPELPPDIAAMLRAERQAPEPPGGVRDAILARVHASATGASATAHASTPAPPVTAGTFAATAKSVIIGVAALAIVAGSGALWVSQHGSHATPAARTPFATRASALRGMLRPAVQLEPTPEVPAAAQPAPTEAAPVVPAIQPSVVVSPVVARTTAPTPHTDEGILADDIGDERALLDPVRAAIARQDVPAARAALQEYVARYPHGRLAEEREGMWIEVLALDGDRDGAEARATAFRRRYPNSILLPAIESSLRERQ